VSPSSERRDTSGEPPGRRHETRYLDLDGDGVPDAVETTDRAVIHVDGRGVADIVQETDEVDAEIDDDGVPHTVQVTERLAFATDGTAAVAEFVSVERDATPDDEDEDAEEDDEDERR
jgi:hypothetical protein